MGSDNQSTQSTCPSCGAQDIVRVLGSMRPWYRAKARCIACNSVFFVSRASFLKLREPSPQELAGAGLCERLGYMSDASMSAGQIVVAFIGAALGAMISFWFEQPVLILPAIVIAWWLGRLVFPGPLQRRRPTAGLCTSCGYSLRGLPAGHKCPECGASSEVPPKSE
jgi:predicted RNA-binding Zn-ribbon protein involved in translation (DUF1610 family)